jgi:hypothetical protein
LFNQSRSIPQGDPPTLDARREYVARLEHYRQRLWRCKFTGATGLTYEEAVASEYRVSAVVDTVSRFLFFTCLSTVSKKGHGFASGPLDVSYFSAISFLALCLP